MTPEELLFKIQEEDLVERSIKYQTLYEKDVGLIFDDAQRSEKPLAKVIYKELMELDTETIMHQEIPRATKLRKLAEVLAREHAEREQEAKLMKFVELDGVPDPRRPDRRTKKP